MSKTIIELNNVSKSFGKLEVLRNISLKVKENETIIITGPNGSGKTTLLRCIALLEKINDGKIILNNNKITNRTPPTEIEDLIKKQIVGFVFQELHPWPHLTVLENLTKPLMIVKQFSKEKATETSNKILDLVGLTNKKNQYPSFLSGGQKRRLIIARTLVMDPKILLLDEITANLDIELKKEIYSIIRKISKNKTMIIVSHDIEMIKDFVDKIYYLKDGKLKT